MGETSYKDQFDAKYGSEPMEIAVAVGAQDAFCGLILNCPIVAWQDLATGKIHAKYGMLVEMGQNVRKHYKYLKKNSIVTVRVYKSLDESDQSADNFRLAEILSTASKYPELKAIQKKQVKQLKQKQKQWLKEQDSKNKALIKNPNHYNDDVLGRFTMTSVLSGYKNEINWCSEKVTLGFKEGNEAVIQACITHAREIVINQAEWDKRIRQFAASDMTVLANDWNQNSKISEQEFYDRISIVGIYVTAEGEFTFLLDDDNMFREHSVVVNGNIKEGPREADLVG